MTLDFTTWIRDPVHGYIRLTQVERQVIDTAVFQRLRRVKQLGLACLAFPSADYPRFEHSLGVLEITGRLLANVSCGNNKAPSDTQIQQYRMAALLHDIGHYPFSHAMDDAINSYYSGTLIKDSSEDNDITPEQSLSHEKVGELVLRHDEDLNRILKDGGLDPEKIAMIFNREEPSAHFQNMVSSDLDADRLDYLARTSCHTGLPYGRTDIDYLVEHVRVDDKGQVCFDEKALRSVEHVLLGRYFDYQVLVRHRVVAGLEMLLKDVLFAMFETKNIVCTEDRVVDRIKSGDWATFDDLHMMQQIRDFGNKVTDPVLLAKLNCILLRQPPKTVAEAEWFDFAEKESKLNMAIDLVKSKMESWAKSFGIPIDYWEIWCPHKPMGFTKSPATVGVKGCGESLELSTIKDQYEQSPRVMSPHATTSKAIIEMPRSIMSVLSQYKFYAFRIVVIPKDGNGNLAKLDQQKINRRIKEDCKGIDWK